MYSAKKVGGQKLYQLARRGQTIERPKQNIEIYQLAVLSYDWPQLRLLVHCSSGAYIRSLAQDLGQALGCGACLQALIRTKIGPYSLEQAVELKKLTSQNWAGQLLS